jgi:hypothetical protein
MVPVWVVGRLRTHDELRFERVTAGLGSPPVRFATGRKPDLQALRETGATGLEPATSGVTGRSWRQSMPLGSVRERVLGLSPVVRRHGAAPVALADRLRAGRVSMLRAGVRASGSRGRRRIRVFPSS